MTEKRTHWRTPDKTDFLGAADLEELIPDGKTDLIAIIKHVEVKQVKVKGKEDVCRVATFTDPNLKPMIINVTNGKILKSFAGGSKYVEDWNNLPVSIYVLDNIKVAKEFVEGLRFRPQPPKIKKPELTPDHKKWDEAKQAVKDGKLQAVLKRYHVSEDNLKRLNDEV